MRSQPVRDGYGRMTQTIHWISALLIIGLMVMGTLMIRMPDGPTKDQSFQMHSTVGLIVLVLSLIRIAWRFVEPWPAPPAGLSATNQQLFKWVHILLYVVLAAVLLTGVGMLVFSNAGFFPPQVTSAGVGNLPAAFAHGVLTKVFLVLFLMHVGGVVQHHLKEGDALSRMGIRWFARR